MIAEPTPTSTSTDTQTVAYFDQYVPDYDRERGAFISDVLNRLARQHSSVIDIGCGTGSLLLELMQKTSLSGVAGIDVSAKSLEMARMRLAGRFYQKSICDPQITRRIEERFDVAILATVLHHLIGRTRADSRRLSMVAIDHALALLKPGGYLIVLEDVFSPDFLMGVVFYVKKMVARYCPHRVSVFGYWNNIGEPVVSYFSRNSLTELLAAAKDASIIETHEEKKPPTWLMRAMGIRERSYFYVVMQKCRCPVRN